MFRITARQLSTKPFKMREVIVKPGQRVKRSDRLAIDRGLAKLVFPTTEKKTVKSKYSIEERYQLTIERKISGQHHE